jgi:hypothetical protein
MRVLTDDEAGIVVVVTGEQAAAGEVAATETLAGWIVGVAPEDAAGWLRARVHRQGECAD